MKIRPFQYFSTASRTVLIPVALLISVLTFPLSWAQAGTCDLGAISIDPNSVSFSVTPTMNGTNGYAATSPETINLTIYDPNDVPAISWTLNGMATNGTMPVNRTNPNQTLVNHTAVLTFVFNAGSYSGLSITASDGSPCTSTMNIANNTITLTGLTVGPAVAPTLAPMPSANPQDFSVPIPPSCSGSSWGHGCDSFTLSWTATPGLTAYAKWSTSDSQGTSACSSGAADICSAYGQPSTCNSVTFHGRDAYAAGDGSAGTAYLDVCMAPTGGTSSPNSGSYRAVPFNFIGPAPTVAFNSIPSGWHKDVTGMTNAFRVDGGGGGAAGTQFTWGLNGSETSGGSGINLTPTGTEFIGPSVAPSASGVYNLTATVTDASNRPTTSNPSVTSCVTNGSQPPAAGCFLFDNSIPGVCAIVLDTVGGKWAECSNSLVQQRFAGYTSALAGSYPGPIDVYIVGMDADSDGNECTSEASGVDNSGGSLSVTGKDVTNNNTLTSALENTVFKCGTKSADGVNTIGGPQYKFANLSCSAGSGCQFQFTGNVTDLAGNPSGTKTWSFTMGSSDPFINPMNGLSPAQATEGDPGFNLTISGGNFSSTAANNKVTFGTQLPINATAVSGSGSAMTLTVPIPALTPGANGTAPIDLPVKVTVGVKTSAPVNFHLNKLGQPSISNITPSSALVGQNNVSLAITGNGFIDGTSYLQFGSFILRKADGLSIPNQTNAAVPISAAMLSAPGPVSVTICNGSTNCSAAYTFTVTSKLPPHITGLSKSTANQNDSAFTLSVFGDHFESGYKVQWAGADLGSPSCSATLCTAQVSATNLTTAGTFDITVKDPATGGGGTSNPQTFTVVGASPLKIVAPLSPVSKPANSGSFNLTVKAASGSSFDNTCVIEWNGSSSGLTTTPPATGDTTIMALVSNTNISAPGNPTVDVKCVGTGQTSNQLLFQVTSANSGPLIQASFAQFDTSNGQACLSNATVPCTFTYSEPAYVQFSIAGVPFSNGVSVTDGSGNSIPVYTITVGGQPFYLLLMPGVHAAVKSPTYNITATATNPAGTSTLTASIPVSQGPLFPATFNIVGPDSAGTGINIDWAPPTYLNKGGFALQTVSLMSGTPGAGSKIADLWTLATHPTGGTYDLVNLGSITSIYLHVDYLTGNGLVHYRYDTDPLSTSAIAPTVNGLTPATAQAGSPATPLTINGTGFTATSKVYWGGPGTTQLTVTDASQASSGILKASIPPANLATPGAVFVTVCNGTLCDTTQTTFNTFTVTPPPFSKPTTITVTNDPAKTDSQSFHITLARVNNETPACALITWTSPTTGISSFLATGLAATGSFDIPLTGLNSNAAYSGIQAGFGTTCLGTAGGGDPSFSGMGGTVIGGAAWTMPSPPLLPPTISAQTATTISVNLPFPSNDPSTKYYAQAAPLNGGSPDFSLAKQSLAIIQGTPGATSADLTVTGLNTGETYAIRIRVQSGFNINFDQFSPPIVQGTNIPAGHVTAVGIDSITATWTVPTAILPTLVNIRAIAYDTSNNAVSMSPPIVPEANPTIKVDLLTSNTSYIIRLSRFDGANWSDFSGSGAPATTLAVPPTDPQANFTGTRAAITLKMTLLPDNNSPDSLYAVEITPDKQSPMYLDGSGSGNLIPVCAVNTAGCNAWKKLSDWTAGTASNFNAALATAYSLRLGVAQVLPSKTVFSNPQPLSSPGSPITVSYPPLNGALFDNYFFGVGTGGAFSAKFSTDMLDASVKDPAFYTLTKMDDATPSTLPVNVAYDSVNRLASVTPATPMDPASLYQINIADGIKDNFDFPTTQTFTQKFITGLSPNTPTTVYSPYDTAKANKIVVDQTAATAFGANSYIILRTAFICNPVGNACVGPGAPVTAPASGIDSAANANPNLRTLKEVEVLVNLNGAADFGTAPAPVTLTLSAQPGGASLAPSLAGAPAAPSNVDLSTLQISQYVAGQGLVPVPGSTNNGDGTATAKITKSGVYFLRATVSTDLSGAKAYPVPFKPSIGHTVITFSGLAPDSVVKVYTIMGELVQTLTTPDTNGLIEWPVTNKDGATVASGVYIYQIKNSFSEKRGKLIIVR